jgi:hypothetical protein
MATISEFVDYADTNDVDIILTSGGGVTNILVLLILRSHSEFLREVVLHSKRVGDIGS